MNWGILWPRSTKLLNTQSKLEIDISDSIGEGHSGSPFVYIPWQFFAALFVHLMLHIYCLVNNQVGAQGNGDNIRFPQTPRRSCKCTSIPFSSERVEQSFHQHFWIILKRFDTESIESVSIWYSSVWLNVDGEAFLFSSFCEQYFSEIQLEGSLKVYRFHYQVQVLLLQT